MKKLIFLFVLIISSGLNTVAQFKSPTFDPAWANRFQTVLDSARVASGAKGASLAVLVPGQGLFTGVTGISYPGYPIPKRISFVIG